MEKPHVWENKTDVSGEKISWWYDGIIFLHGIYTIGNKRKETLFQLINRLDQCCSKIGWLLYRHMPSIWFSSSVSKKLNSRQRENIKKWLERGKKTWRENTPSIFCSLLFRLLESLYVGFFFLYFRSWSCILPFTSPSLVWYLGKTLASLLTVYHRMICCALLRLWIILQILLKDFFISWSSLQGKKGKRDI